MRSLGFAPVKTQQRTRGDCLGNFLSQGGESGITQQKCSSAPASLIRLFLSKFSLCCTVKIKCQTPSLDANGSRTLAMETLFESGIFRGVLSFGKAAIFRK